MRKLRSLTKVYGTSEIRTSALREVNLDNPSGDDYGFDPDKARAIR